MYAGFSLIPSINLCISLIALDIVAMFGISNVRVIDATIGELTVEWVEPGNGCGCDCISGYIVRVNGNDNGITDCNETEATIQLQLCVEHHLTIVPVLNNGITVESSSSNVAPVLIGKLKFPAQQLVVGKHTICSRTGTGLLSVFGCFTAKKRFGSMENKAANTVSYTMIQGNFRSSFQSSSPL